MACATQNNASFIAVPKKDKIVEDLVAKSPFEFKYITESLDAAQARTGVPGINPAGVASHVSTVESTTSTRKMPNQDFIKTFVVHVFPSLDFKHKTTIRYSPLHGPWPKTDKQDQDLVFAALKEVVPEGVAQTGLCDWQTGEQLSDEARMLRARVEESRLEEVHLQDRRQRIISRVGSESIRKQTLAGLTSLMNLRESLMEDQNGGAPLTRQPGIRGFR